MLCVEASEQSPHKSKVICYCFVLLFVLFSTYSNSDDMRTPALAKRTSQLKETQEGAKTMCELLEEMKREAREEGRNVGREEGREEGRAEGRLEGRKEGHSEGKKESQQETFAILRNLGADEDLIRKLATQLSSTITMT